MRYITFLRGINVGGNKRVGMAELAECYSKLGLTDVKAAIQTGNVAFESSEANQPKLKQEIKKAIFSRFGFDVEIAIVSLDEMKALVAKEPFAGTESQGDIKSYVTFLTENPGRNPAIPLFSKKKDVEIISRSGIAVFSLAYAVGDGHYGFPNSFVEKEFAVKATSRYWSTVLKLV